MSKKDDSKVVIVVIHQGVAMRYPRCCEWLLMHYAVATVFLLVYMQYRNRTKVGLIACFPNQTLQTHEYLTLLLAWSRFPHPGKTPLSNRCSENL